MSSSGNVAADQQYFCHQCSRTFTITPSAASSELLCPNCNGGFIEENPNPNPSFSNPRSFSFSSDNHSSCFSAHGDSPLDFSTSLAGDVPTEVTDIIGGATRSGSDDGGGSGGGSSNSDNTGIEIITQLISLTNSLRRRRVAPPAAKSAVEALPHVTISEEMLGGDHTECVVCKDSFRTGEEAKQMPCKHIYHSDCIVPWLELHNTCPICRYKLPIDDPDYESGVRYVTQSSVGGFDAVTTAAAVISGGLQENVGSPRTMERSFPIRIPRWFRTSGEGSDGRDDGRDDSCPVCGYELPPVDPEYENWVAAFIAGGFQDNVGPPPRATETSFLRQFRTSGEGSDGRDGGSNNSCPACRYELPTNDPDYESWVRDGNDGESDAVDAAAVIAGGLHDNTGAPRAMERSFLRQFRTSGEGSDGRDGGSNNSCPGCQYELLTDDPDYESSVRDRSVAEFDALVASCRVLQENVEAPRATEKSFPVQSPRQCRTSGEGSDGRDGGSSSSSSENDNVGGSNSSGEAKEEDLD